MSSTKRGSKRSPADNYPTPRWCVHRLLEALPLPTGTWLEPGVGNGDIVRAVLEKKPEVNFFGFDLRATKFIKTSDGTLGNHIVGNLLKPDAELLARLSGPKFNVSIGNPPFRLAAEFIDFSLKYAERTVMLLRLNYLGSDKRAEFMQTYCPDVFVLPNRPSFRPSKRGLLTTDSIEYGWFYWGPEEVRAKRDGMLHVLKTTPKEERRRGKR